MKLKTKKGGFITFSGSYPDDEGVTIELYNSAGQFQHDLGFIDALEMQTCCGIIELNEVEHAITVLKDHLIMKDIQILMESILKSFRKHAAFISITIVWKWKGAGKKNSDICKMLEEICTVSTLRARKNPNSKNKIKAFIY